MKRRIRFILAVFLICLEFGATFVQAGQKQREQQEEETRQKLMEDMELGQMQDAVNQILKHSQREELAFLTSLAGLLVVLFWVLPYIYELFQTIEDLFSL